MVDLSVHPAGAIVAMHLGEYGARVVRVDTAEDVASAYDEALWRYANRTKEMVPAGDAVVRDLVSRADVVVVDLPAGELERAGLDAARVRADNASLIHAWMPPHAVRGPAADLPADELLLWAWTGLASQQPGATSDHPVAPVVPIITYEQGALGATAIAAALIERATRGAVRSLTVSGLHAVNAMNTSIRIDLPGIFRPFGANKDGTGVSPQFRMYRCRDGVWVFLCALTPPFFFKLIEALDLMEIMLLPEVEGEFARFVQPEVQAIVNARFAERMAERDSDEWARRFDELGVPYAPVQTREEWAASATVAANDLLLPVPGDDATTGPGLPAVLSTTPGSLDRSDADGTAADPVRVVEPVTPALPLDGVLVVDATKFLAGPFGCLVLQDLGARVVKVDPPGGEDFRTVAAASYCALNRDKDQVSIDLKDAAGREAFTALVHRADALVENMGHQVVDKLGLDVGAFRAGNAGLVHCHIDGWGAGPLAETPGFDPLLQARQRAHGCPGRPRLPGDPTDVAARHRDGHARRFRHADRAVRPDPSRRGTGRGSRAQSHVGRVPGRRVHVVRGPAGAARRVHRLRGRRPCAPLRRGGRRLARGLRDDRGAADYVGRDPRRRRRCPRRSHGRRGRPRRAGRPVCRRSWSCPATTCTPAPRWRRTTASSPSTTTTSERCG